MARRGDSCISKVKIEVDSAVRGMLALSEKVAYLLGKMIQVMFSFVKAASEGFLRNVFLFRKRLSGISHENLQLKISMRNHRPIKNYNMQMALAYRFINMFTNSRGGMS